MANHGGVSELSDSSGAIRNGPESPYVVAVIDALLGGDSEGAAEALDSGAEATTWAAVLHRLDVAGRALAGDPELASVEIDWDDAADRLGWHLTPAACRAAEASLQEWAAGRGVAVSVDLTTDSVDARTDRERVWPAVVAVAWLVDRSGYPAQVVA